MKLTVDIGSTHSDARSLSDRPQRPPLTAGLTESRPEETKERAARGTWGKCIKIAAGCAGVALTIFAAYKYFK